MIWKVIKIWSFITLGTFVVAGIWGYIIWPFLFSDTIVKNLDTLPNEVVVRPAQYGLPEIGIKSFSLSPDNQWLFVIGFTETGEYKYILQNFQSGKITLIPNNQKMEQTALLSRPGCWDQSSSKIFIQSQFINTAFSLDIGSPTLWQEQEGVRDMFGTLNQCQTRNIAFEISNLVHIKETNSGKSVEITSAKESQKILATHTLNGVVEEGVTIGDTVISPDGKNLAYIFSYSRAGFAPPPEGYIINLRGEPELKFLGYSVYGPFQWSADSKYIYALADNSEISGRRYSIIRWKVK
ncbi:MAG: hypothetical protein Q7R69_03620 [bacterium]|nr:hypothetical protein [bacterium]